jgi:hypothetical protein
VYLKKNSEGCPIFSLSVAFNPNLSICPPIPAAREPIFVVNLVDHPRKKGATMQKANVSLGKPKMNKMMRRRELPCVSHLRALYKG